MSPLDIERATMRAWPAGETFEHASGWHFLAASGVTGRVNAVWPLAWRGGDIEATIDDAEAWYRARKLPPRFKLTEGAAAPTDLAKTLERRGYERVMDTLIMTRALVHVPAPGGEMMSAGFLHEPFETALKLSTPDAEERAERLGIARRAPEPCLFVCSGLQDTKAIGMSAMADDLAGIFLMRTMPNARRQGHARAILRTLLSWAQAQRARNAFLQVDADNTGAVALYRSEGFTTLTSYCFWRQAR